MASKAFGLTAYYDSIVAEWYNQKLGIKFPERKTFFGKKTHQLRYGENPHQKSSIYISDFKNDDTNLVQLSGKDLSYNNYNDIFAALDILFSFTRKRQYSFWKKKIEICHKNQTFKKGDERSRVCI